MFKINMLLHNLTVCYVGFGSPARLLRQATRKELQVPTEEECKAECSKFRENTLFQCMSFSYSTKSPKWEPNCKLSDILQRDLLPNVDFITDHDSWLFAWDNYNPECRAVANEPVHNQISHKEDPHHYDIYNAIGTWRVYSVSGWPCRRGTLCKENRVAGFWYCDLEGGDDNTWDYCCRPDHQCGFSEGFPYQWCYVGPARTQWRKCSDKYYPYIHNLIDRFDRPPSHGHPWSSGSNHLPDHRPPPGGGSYLPERPPSSGGGYLPERPPSGGSYLPERPPLNGGGYLPDRPPLGGGSYLPERPPSSGSYLPERPPPGSYLPEHGPPPGYHPDGYLSDHRPPPYRPGIRPDRPPAPPTRPPPRPSLDEYETQFDSQFLDPPKPGGFGQPRHWPLSYLHKEMPPNSTDSDSRLMSMTKGGDNPKYAAIQNLIDIIKSNDLKNVQYQITNESNKDDDILFVRIPLPTNFTEETKSEKIVAKEASDISDPIDLNETKNDSKRSQKSLPSQDRLVPVYRRGFITRTNVTSHRSRSSRTL